MRKKLFIILSILVFMGTTTIISYLSASRWNLTDFHINHVSITSEELPEDFDNASFLFFSDLDYGTYFTSERLDKFAKILNNLQSDFVLFGGDLFNDTFTPVTEDVNVLTAFFKNIEAPYGKFAVLGDFDVQNDQRKALVSKILTDADFEILDHKCQSLHLNGSTSINLAGFNYTDKDLDFTETFSSVQSTTFNMVLMHGAAQFDNLPLAMCDLALSGHTHHLQVNAPFFIDFGRYPMTGKYRFGLTEKNNSSLLVTRGVGTTDSDYRFNADPEVVYLKLVR